MRAAAAATLRTLPRAALAIPSRIRRWLIFGITALVVLWSLYTFWFRHSSFVKVEHVTVKGLNTNDADRIRQALTSTARDMSTLDVNQAALLSAVASYTAVKDVVATAHFPHGLTIRVIQERPVALLQTDGSHVLLAADGSVLRGIRAGGPLPAIRTRSAAPTRTLTDPLALTELQVAAAAPPALARRIASIGSGKTRGLVVRLRNGPQIIFGDGTRLDAKWAAAAGVLADSASKGATYVDVRLPERPVAGGLATSSLVPLGSTSTSSTALSGESTTTQTGTAPQGATGATGPSGTTTPSQAVQPAGATQTQGTAAQPTLTRGGGAAATNPQP
jgi:cell division protein FtsQ